MSKVKVVVTSTSGVDYLPFKDEVEILRLKVNFNNQEYVDFLELNAGDFYNKLLEKPNADVSTSQVPVGEMVEAFERLKGEGYTDLIVIALSSELSGTYQAVLLAKDMVEGINIVPFDSKSVAVGESFLAERALELLKKGVSVVDVISELQKIRDKIKILVLVDTLKYLVKNGRLSATSGLLGSLLKIKPLLHIQPDGRLVPLEKIRTTTKAQKRLMEIFFKEVEGKKVRTYIIYTTNELRAEEIKQLILAQRPDITVDLLPLTPVVGAHAGPGTLGLGNILE